MISGFTIFFLSLRKKYFAHNVSILEEELKLQKSQIWERLIDPRVIKRQHSSIESLLCQHFRNPWCKIKSGACFVMNRTPTINMFQTASFIHDGVIGVHIATVYAIFSHKTSIVNTLLQ